MPLEAIKNKAIRGEAVSNGEIIIAVDAVYQQAKKTNGRVTDTEEDVKKLKGEVDGINQALGALTNAKIAEAARHQGLMVIPRFSWKVLSLVGVAPLFAIFGYAWHFGALLQQTAETASDTHREVVSHTEAITTNQQISQLNQKAILKLLNENEAKRESDAAPK